MKHSGLSITDLPIRAQEQVLAQLAIAGKTKAAAPMSNAIRQQHGPALNKLEDDFHRHLTSTFKPLGDTILVQPVALLLGNGVRYTPDFLRVANFVAGSRSVTLDAYEVKGPRFWDDARVKIKVAASLYPWIRFVLVTRKGRTAPWVFTEVLP